MTACRIERRIEDVPGLLIRVRAECEKFRSLWDGDEHGGNYELRTPVGKIIGTYSVDDGNILFLVEKKPRVVPCALIERVLDQFLTR